MRKKLTALTAAIPALLQAQETEPINTDRPDQSDAVYIMQPGKLQLETGFFFNNTGFAGQSVLHSNMLRYGIFKGTELRLVVEEGTETNRDENKTRAGMYPLAFCFKTALEKDCGLIPDITLSAYLRLPITASENFKPLWVQSTAILVFQHTISQEIVFSYNAGITRDGDDKRVFFPVTAVLSYAPFKKISFFSEYYASYQTHSYPLHNIDSGILFLVKPQMQFDIAFAHSLAAPTKSNYITVGFSYRFSKKV
jgi:hypothetical protein